LLSDREEEGSQQSWTSPPPHPDQSSEERERERDIRPGTGAELSSGIEDYMYDGKLAHE